MALPASRERTTAASQRRGGIARVLARRDWWRIALLAGIAALPVLLYLPLLGEPFDRDEGAYATVAQGLLRGDLPYRDLFDHKPPIVYGWYALSFVLFGEHVESPRILAMLALSATTLLVHIEGRWLGSARAALVAAALFAASSGFALLQLSANTEVFMLLPLTASLVCATAALRRPRTDRTAFLLLAAAGTLGGLATLTKPTAAWNVLTLCVVVLIAAWRSEGRRGRAAVAPGAYVLGAALAGMLVAAPWLLLGAIEDFIYANFSYNLLYSAQYDAGERLLSVVVGSLHLMRAGAPLVVAGVLGLAAMRTRWRWPADALLVAWLLGSALGVASTGRFFLHYFVQLLPALALLAVPFVERVRREGWLDSAPPSRMATFTALAVAAAVPALWSNGHVYLQPTLAARHEAKFQTPQSETEAVGPELGARLAARTAPGERIFNFGRDSQLYFYADRAPVGRFFYDRPYWLDPATLDEALADLEATPPALIVDTTLLTEPLAELGITAELEGYYYPPALAALLAERYRYAGRVGYAEVYELLEAPRAP